MFGGLIAGDADGLDGMTAGRTASVPVGPPGARLAAGLIGAPPGIGGGGVPMLDPRAGEFERNSR
jgi:hypothetical protein